MSTPRETVSIYLRGVALLAMTACLGRAELIERRPELAKYQDAWKSLLTQGKYYLYMRTYEEEPFYGYKQRCVFTELISVNEKENYTVNNFGSLDPKDGSVKNGTAYAWVKTSDGYPIPNVIESSNTLEKDFTVDYVMAFLEYDNCEIMRLPHRNNGCELWVKDGKVDDIKSLCFFIYHLLCGPEKYMVYDKQMCKGA
ncbi:male-specific histamine-binding salivary protein-like [Dermacentor silvarum]|uniref:male-specific histamine-binding salivary protein-like n=1 Tax=Dermacentor silvarum TaxID=543639 RepID=UPI00210120B7|nr:male-specific histamine-binding salivary protein-like [Dermacentor silvarum]